MSAISSARLRPTLRATATSGVWQNSPPLPPGMANDALSAATAQVARGHQLAACRRGQGMDPGDDGLRDRLDRVHHLGAHIEQMRDVLEVGARHVGKVVAGGEHRAVGGEDRADRARSSRPHGTPR